MAFQLTLSQKNLPAAETLKRKTVITVTTANATLGPAEATCPVPGYQGGTVTLTVDQDGKHRLEGPEEVCLNRCPCQPGSQVIRSGDTITMGEWTIQFHVCHRKVGQSWRSSVLATVAKSAIGIILAMVLLAMFWLPSTLSNHTNWGNQAAQEELSMSLDSARRNVKQVMRNKELDAFTQYFLEHITSELDHRVRYVRHYGQRLSSRQRQTLLHDVNELMALMYEFVSDKSIQQVPDPKLDEAIRKIIADRLKAIN